MNYRVIKPSGILDGLATNQMRHGIDNLVAEGTDTILLDLQQVTFMNGSGLDALKHILKIVDSRGARLFLCSLNPPIRMIFELSRMEDSFQIYHDRTAFEESLAVA